MVESETVELSEDKVKMRPKVTPDKWPLVGPIINFSNLKVDVPEFVPGQMFTVANASTHSKPQETGEWRTLPVLLVILYRKCRLGGHSQIRPAPLKGSEIHFHT